MSSTAEVSKQEQSFPSCWLVLVGPAATLPNHPETSPATAQRPWNNCPRFPGTLQEPDLILAKTAQISQGKGRLGRKSWSLSPAKHCHKDLPRSWCVKPPNLWEAYVINWPQSLYALKWMFLGLSNLRFEGTQSEQMLKNTAFYGIVNPLKCPFCHT